MAKNENASFLFLFNIKKKVIKYEIKIKAIIFLVKINKILPCKDIITQEISYFRQDS